ncbi:MAG TPA: GNAT family protein [Caulobacteraceae bacterium]
MILPSELTGFDTSRFIMRPLTPEDAPDLFAHLADPAVTAFMDIDPLQRVEQAEAIVDWAEGLRRGGEGARFSIRVKAGGEFLGTCGFNSLVLERGCRGEIAYDLARAWQGRGVMAEVMPALIDLGLGRLRLQRLEAFVTPGNEPSCRLLERHGFACEGTLRDYGFWKDRFWDQLLYAKTARA